MPTLPSQLKQNKYTIHFNILVKSLEIHFGWHLRHPRPVLQLPDGPNELLDALFNVQTKQTVKKPGIHHGGGELIIVSPSLVAQSCWHIYIHTYIYTNTDNRIRLYIQYIYTRVFVFPLCCTLSEGSIQNNHMKPTVPNACTIEQCRLCMYCAHRVIHQTSLEQSSHPNSADRLQIMFHVVFEP